MTKVSSAAGGFGALASTAKHVVGMENPLRGLAALLDVNRPTGFDCPGCAWPERENAGALDFCENGAKAVAWEATAKTIGASFFSEHTITSLLTRTDHWLEGQGRLAEPMRYDAETDRYLPVSWENAFAEIGSVLQGLLRPDAAVFYTSGRTSNEAAFLYQLFGRAFGTNNFPDCSNLCHESSGFALIESIGVGKGTVTLDDFEQADLIIVVGQNPATNHPRMLSELQRARRRGARIVAINPLKEIGLVAFRHPKEWGALSGLSNAALATTYIQPTIGGDHALFKGIGKALCEMADSECATGKILDTSFIDQYTHGYETYRATLAGQSWSEIVEQSGIPEVEIRSLANIYAGGERVIACWAMGLTQQLQAVATIQELVNLMLLRGNVGKPGAGLCPVRGHSNVQGDRTMGINEKPSAWFLDNLQRTFRFAPPREHGLDVVRAIDAMHKGEVQAFMAMGGNFAAAAPDPILTAAALRQCNLTVSVATKLNRTILQPGARAFILPCLGRTERDMQATGLQHVSVEDSMSMVHASQGSLAPCSPLLKSEVAIVAGIASATLGEHPIPWNDYAADYSRIRGKIAEVLPAFADYDSRLSQKGGFYLGNDAANRKFTTAHGKAMFVSKPLAAITREPGVLRLMTVRSHDQYNTTIYGTNDRYRGIRGERKVVFMNAHDMADRNISDGARIDISSAFPGFSGQVLNFRVKAYDIPRGCAMMYFPEGNALMPLTYTAERSNTPCAKDIPVRIASCQQ